MIKVIQKEETYPLRHHILRPNQPFEDIVYSTDDDANTFHLGYYLKEQLVSIASFNPEKLEDYHEKCYRLRAMATLPEYRRQGYGSLLVRQGIRILKRNHVKWLWCKGRVNVQGYYESLGFSSHGEPFDYPTLGPHIVMKRKIHLPITFREAQDTDMPLIAKYRLQSHFTHAVSSLSFDVNAYYRRLNNRFLQFPSLQLMVLLDGRVHGYLGLEIREELEKSYGYIHFLYLESFYQNQGYGQEIMNYAIELFKNKSLDKVKLRVKSNNQQALKAYKKQGFYIEMEEDHQYLMVKKI
ncbi:MAG: GNAT family N-acetyltransferase [Clostridia bacterium]|nr:GNAT family N-acetyltransferase [Clostridia bacterium]